MNYAGLEKTIMARLRKELDLDYHSWEHTRDVIQAAREIAAGEGFKGKALLLLETAALLHDTGFLIEAKGHEEHSCALAGEYLPRYGYSEEDLHEVCAMIRATRLPQHPESPAGKILADADLDYLGRDDFFTLANRLYRELHRSGTIKNERDWNLLQEKFIGDHRYFTETSRKKRNTKKAENLRLIRTKLNQV